MIYNTNSSDNYLYLSLREKKSKKTKTLEVKVPPLFQLSQQKPPYKNSHLIVGLEILACK